MESPDSVSRVAPPTSTIAKTSRMSEKQPAPHGTKHRRRLRLLHGGERDCDHGRLLGAGPRPGKRKGARHPVANACLPR